MIALSIQTPAEINRKLAVKRKSDEYRLAAVKRPCYRGTIYEKRLLPMPAATILPVQTNVCDMPRCQQVDKKLQTRFIGLLQCDDTVDELNRFLSENSDKIDINEYGEDGVTPLQRICQVGGDVEVAQTLIRFGADPRLTSRDGWSAVHMASFSGNTKLMRYLLATRSS